MERFIIVASVRDVASLNIANTLIKDHSFVEGKERFDGHSVFHGKGARLIFVKRDLIYADYLNDHFAPEAYIFLSRHKSESHKPCLTAHFPGNLTHDSSYGGRPKEVAYTHPGLHKEHIKQLWNLKDSVMKYQIVMEATHHGPTSLVKPVLFVEIGSTDNEWKDEGASEVVGKALMEALRAKPSYKKVGIGFGGTHYSEKFTKVLLESEFALGAVAPKYTLPFVDEKIVGQMVDKCHKEVRYAVLDWKGLGEEKKRVVGLLQETGLEIIKV